MEKCPYYTPQRGRGCKYFCSKFNLYGLKGQRLIMCIISELDHRWVESMSRIPRSIREKDWL